MGFRAGSDDENDEQTGVEAQTPSGADAEQETAPPGAAAKPLPSKRGIFLLLGGLVVAGLAAGWSWMRGLPKDEP